MYYIRLRIWKKEERKQEKNLEADAIQNETQMASKEVAQQVRDYNKLDASDGGLLGDIVDLFK